jgi:hypothetical protein
MRGCPQVPQPPVDDRASLGRIRPHLVRTHASLRRGLERDGGRSFLPAARRELITAVACQRVPDTGVSLSDELADWPDWGLAASGLDRALGVFAGQDYHSVKSGVLD